MENLSGNLSVAFYWHMHQPVYELDGVFLMPWVRLHAVKDYLDMVTLLEKYPRLKLNIDVVPALLDELIQYAEQGFDEEICDIVYHHHENNDGSGYPCNISGDDIPLGARIIRVCDVYTALISKRSYREAFSKKIAVELMIEEAKHFDMKIFLAFLRVLHSEDNKSIEKLLEKSIEKDAADYFKKYITGETNLTS